MLNHLKGFLRAFVRVEQFSHVSRRISGSEKRFGILYGSVVAADFLPERSDINSLILFDSFMAVNCRSCAAGSRRSEKTHRRALCLSVQTFAHGGTFHWNSWRSRIHISPVFLEDRVTL
jgi:hypothetical protein